MVLRHTRHWWVYLIVLGMVGVLATGCSTVRGIVSPEDSPALIALLDANEAINASHQAGASKYYPAELTDLEQRYQIARSTYQDGNEKQALEMAQRIIDEANDLSAKAMQMAQQPAPAPPPANQPPVARLQAPSESDVNTTVSFDASASSDQNADSLTYHWDFGDGKTISSTSSTITHQYAKADNYTVRLRVSDGRGGSDSISQTMQITVPHILHSTVLFGYKQKSLQPSAKEQLASLVQRLRQTPGYQVELTGHTDSVASSDYNLQLSRQRAEVVRDFLLTQGVAAHQIHVDWKGETQPIASNATEAGRIQNRRTEITLRPMSGQQSRRPKITREAMTTQ